MGHFCNEVWDRYRNRLGSDWEVYHSGNDWKVFVSENNDPILCEKFAGYLGSKGRIEKIAYFDQGWVVTKRDARIGTDAMRALLDAYEGDS
jgi:hypothetical protein